MILQCNGGEYHQVSCDCGNRLPALRNSVRLLGKELSEVQITSNAVSTSVLQSIYRLFSANDRDCKGDNPLSLAFDPREPKANLMQRACPGQRKQIDISATSPLSL